MKSKPYPTSISIYQKVIMYFKHKYFQNSELWLILSNYLKNYDLQRCLHKQTCKVADKQTEDRHTNWQTNRQQKGRKTDRRTYRQQTDKQSDKQTGKHTSTNQTDRQEDKKMDIPTIRQRCRQTVGHIDGETGSKQKNNRWTQRQQI